MQARPELVTRSWQLVVNTGATIVTFLMVFLIQRAQNKDNKAIELKLNELVAALEGASNRLIDVESLSGPELELLHRHYRKLVAMSQRDDGFTKSSPTRSKKPRVVTAKNLASAMREGSILRELRSTERLCGSVLDLAPKATNRHHRARRKRHWTSSITPALPPNAKVFSFGRSVRCHEAHENRCCSTFSWTRDYPPSMGQRHSMRRVGCPFGSDRYRGCIDAR